MNRAQGWIAGDIAPPQGGKYERLSAIGVSVDVWDPEYCCWRREGHRVESDDGPNPPGFRGVICANQDLPWRPVSR